MSTTPHTTAPAGKRHTWWATIALVVACFAVAAYWTTRLDIGLYDETAYLQRGIAIDTEGLPAADMAPLYSLWYRLLQVFWPDPVERYLVNLGFTIAVLPILLFLVLRRVGVTLIAALATAIVVLVSTLNVLNWPRVSAFALIILLLGIWLQAGTRSRDRGWAYLFCAVFIVVYIRPEFAIGVVGIVACWSVDVVGRVRSGTPFNFRPIVVSFIVALLLGLSLGSPFGHGRSMVAFGQHYAVNRINSSDTPMDPWTGWETIAQAELGTTTSLSDAFTNAPDRVAWHLGYNLRHLLPTLGRMVLPAGTRLDRMAIVLLVLLTVLLLRQLFVARPPLEHRSIPMELAVLSWSLPPLLAAFVIHPRQHYLIFPAVFLLLPLLALTYSEQNKVPRWASWATGMVAGAILSLSAGRSRDFSSRPTLATIQVLRGIELPAGPVVLDADGGYATYMEHGSIRIPAQEKDTLFLPYITNREVNVIVASPRLEGDPRFKNDPTWKRFKEDPGSHGFKLITVQGTNVRLYVASGPRP